MGQQDVLELCKSQPDRWFTSHDFCDELNQSLGVVNVACRKLRKYGWIQCRKVKPKSKAKVAFEYKHKEEVYENETNGKECVQTGSEEEKEEVQEEEEELNDR